MRLSNFSSVVAALLASLLILGCASGPQPSGAVEDLHAPIQGAEAIALTNELTYTVPGAFNRATVGLLPGRYRLEKENAVGKFYVGAAPSVWWITRDGFVVARGGIWLPANSSESPRIYAYPSAHILGRDREEAMRRLAERSKADGESNAARDQAVLDTAIRNTPSTLAPVQAGLAAGLATAIIFAMTGGEELPQLYPAPDSTAFATAIRALVETREVPGVGGESAQNLK